MKKKNRLLGVATCFALVLILIGTAWAEGPDKVTLTGISTTPSSTQSGQGNNYTITETVNAGGTINLSFIVGVSGWGKTSTSYPGHIMYITALTNTKPDGASDVSVTGLNNCELNARLATCNESATITAPATPGAYQVRIDAEDGINGTGGMTGNFFFINFTVAIPSCTPAATTLVLSEPDCVVYHDGSVLLSATLKSGDTALVGKTITFYVEGKPVGMADTNSDGVATLNYDPSSLTVGDYALTAEWQSDDACYQTPTVTGAPLGIQYMFLGFQSPINADGSTILKGKVVVVKIKIVDANAVPVDDATALVFFIDGTQTIVGTVPENATTGQTPDYGNVMRYSDYQYVYNWDLSTVTNGTKTVRVFLGEGSCAPAHQVIVSVDRKK